MDTLKELAQLLTKSKKGSIPFFENPTLHPSKQQLFIKGLCGDIFNSDEDAAIHFKFKNNKDPKYKKLKSAVYGQMLNMVLFLDAKDLDESSKAYQTCYKEWAALRIISGKVTGTTNRILLGKKILKKALKYELTEVVVNVARMLRIVYANQIGSKKEFEYYDQIFKRHSDILVQVSLAEELYCRLGVVHLKIRGKKDELKKQANLYYQQIEPALKKYDTVKLHLLGRLIETFTATSANDYEKSVEICTRAILFFESKKIFYKRPILIFKHQLLAAYTQLQQFKLGQQIAEEGFSWLSDGEFNWFKHLELYFILAMHTEKYQNCYDIYLKATKHKCFKFLPPQINQTWKLFNAYIHYLIKLDKIKKEKNDKEFKNFRLQRFLNEVPNFAKDKRGFNVPVLIVHILFSIHFGKYDVVIDRIEAIEKYCSRYLKTNEESFRSNCFIKMLLEIPKSGFHQAGVRRKTVQLFKKLQSVPLEVANQAYEIEIIPYEILWIFVVDSLNVKFYRRKNKSICRL